MNDNLLIAAVLREVAEQIDTLIFQDACTPKNIRDQLRERAAELDPPEKNEQPSDRA